MVQERVGEPRAELEVVQEQRLVRERSQGRPERLKRGFRAYAGERLETHGTEQDQVSRLRQSQNLLADRCLLRC